VKVTRVYERNARSKARYPVNVGGARSTKSYSIAQLLIQRLLSRRNRKILVTRKTFPALRLTAYKLVVDLLSDYGYYGRLHHDKVSHIISCPWNGSFIAFLSIDDPEKIKSTEWNDVWMEEASEFEWNDFVVLQTRLSAPCLPDEPNQIFLSLNPTDEEGWINQKLILGPSFAGKVELIESTYRDNPFLDPEYVSLLQGLKDQDPNAYQVYAEGKFGKLTNIIYAPYTVVPEFPADFDETFYGLDFGFNNPSALLEINVKDKVHHYLRQLVYQTGLTNGDLIEKVKTIIPPKHRRRTFFADAAEPARIEEFHKAGFNIHPADKEVKVGIDFCKRQKFYTLSSNVDLNKERSAYKWKTDKNGNVLDEPVKFMDHLMDAKRYGIYSRAKKIGGQPSITVFDNE
jgi:phage terminase large subunit